MDTWAPQLPKRLEEPSGAGEKSDKPGDNSTSLSSPLFGIGKQLTSAALYSRYSEID